MKQLAKSRLSDKYHRALGDGHPHHSGTASNNETALPLVEVGFKVTVWCSLQH